MSTPVPPTGPPGLLVSVRSADEALAALQGGAALVDVKEPRHGALGRADDAVIAAVIAAVAGRRPVSAALGELLDDDGRAPPAGLAFVKWGLAGYGPRADWTSALAARQAGGARTVAVAYADWQCARAPSVDAVAAFAAARGGVLLLDTCCKEASRRGAPVPTLLDWLPAAAVAVLCRRCRAAGVRVAVAGSLGPDEIHALRPAAPDWFAVRGAACAGGRDGSVCAARVRALAELIRGGAGTPGRGG